MLCKYKKQIIKALCTGYTKSNIKIEELPYWLKPIFTTMEGKGIRTNENPFWRYENRHNRDRLINDIARYKNKITSYNSHFEILNTYENGDAYGIKKDYTL